MCEHDLEYPDIDPDEEEDWEDSYGYDPVAEAGNEEFKMRAKLWASLVSSAWTHGVLVWVLYSLVSPLLSD